LLNPKQKFSLTQIMAGLLLSLCLIFHPKPGMVVGMLRNVMLYIKTCSVEIICCKPRKINAI